MDPTGAALYVRPNADLPPPEEEKPRVVLFGDSGSPSGRPLSGWIGAR